MVNGSSLLRVETYYLPIVWQRKLAGARAVCADCYSSSVMRAAADGLRQYQSSCIAQILLDVPSVTRRRD